MSDFIDVSGTAKNFICTVCQNNSALKNMDNPNYIGCPFRHIDNSYCDNCITYSHFISFILYKGGFLD